MVNIVIFGAPGSGKGTQSERIIERYGLYHISTGDVLRRQIAEGTELGRLADSYISEGHLIPDDLMLEVLAHELNTHPEEVKRGVIFDGFPRTIPQAEALAKMLNERGTDIHAVVGLEVDEDELTRRLINRGRETGRSDDNLETIRERMKVYHTLTQPLKEYYVNSGKYHGVDGSGHVDKVFDDIKSKLDTIGKTQSEPSV